MKVHCYLGLVEPEDLYCDLVRHGQPENDAAAIVDQAIEYEYRQRRERLARERAAREREVVELKAQGGHA